MKRPHEAAGAGTLQVSRRVRRKTCSAEVHAGGVGGGIQWHGCRGQGVQEISGLGV